MTERLYYNDSFLLEFEAKVVDVRQENGRTAIVLDRTAFYPTSGGQVFDTGWLNVGGANVPVVEVADGLEDSIYHYVDPSFIKQLVHWTVSHPHQYSLEVELEGTSSKLRVGEVLTGVVDGARRRDHMQQHSGQHVLSAVFEKLFDMRTVSFHMGNESCTIDLDTKSLSDAQMREAEREANRVVTEDLPVAIRSAEVEQAKAMGVRKIPDHVEGPLRLIDMQGYDLNACGGTHVRATGQIGAILLRKSEKVRQGYRVEFVCGERAVRTAHLDFETLTEAARLYDTQIWQLPELIRKSQDEVKGAAKERKKLLEELAELLAARMLGETAGRGTASSPNSSSSAFKLVKRVFEDRDTAFIKLLAQKITAAGRAVVLLGAKSGQAGVVFAQSPGLAYDMGALMKEALAMLGGRGGGSRDLAQGGAADPAKVEAALEAAAATIS